MNPYKHKEPTPAQSQHMHEIQVAAWTLHQRILETLPSRERSLALTNLEQTVMWANKGVVL